MSPFTIRGTDCMSDPMSPRTKRKAVMKQPVMKQHGTTSLCIAAVSGALLLGLTACSQASGQDAEQEQNDAGAQDQPDSGATQAQESADEEQTEAEQGDGPPVDPGDREAQEAAGPQPRLGITYDGGVAVLDGATLETLGDFEAEGLLRINPAGDGRHMFLTEGESFRLLDAGTWGEPHGDHNHYYTTDPLLSEVTVEGPAPGHVVAHDGQGALFFDGNGEIHTFDLTDLDVQAQLSTEVAETEHPHHGVGVAFEDGSRFETLGDDQERPGARVLDADGEEIARNEECPGVHGEAAGPDGVVAVGCEEGVLVWNGAEFTKIDAGPDYARTGNLFPAADSSIMLGDYNETQDEPMTSVALVDVKAGEITTAEIGAAYNFRSLARGPEAEALVMAEDGHLHVLDSGTGEQITSIEVMQQWTEPDQWQEPRPAIQVVNDIAYITDPAEQQIHMVDLVELEVINSADLDVVPNELTAVDGQPVTGVSDGHEGDHEHGDEHDDHDHGDHDHGH